MNGPRQSTAFDEVIARVRESQSAERARLHAEVDRIVDQLEAKSASNIPAALVLTMRRVQAENRARAHAKLDQSLDARDAAAMAHWQTAEREILGEPLQ